MWHFLQDVIRRFIAAGGLGSAAAMAYTTLLGLVPMIALMLSVLSLTGLFDSWREEAVNLMVRVLSPGSLTRVEEALWDFSEHAAAMKGPSLIFLVLTVLFLMEAVYKRFAAIWHEATCARWWVRLAHYVGVAVFVPPLIAVSLWLSAWLAALPWLQGLSVIEAARLQMLDWIPWLMMVAGFYLLYRFAPPVPVSDRAALIGAVLVSVELELLKAGFALYTRLVPTYEIIYGTLAAVPLFLIWLYLMWILILLNATVVWRLDQLWRSRSARSEDTTSTSAEDEAALKAQARRDGLFME